MTSMHCARHRRCASCTPSCPRGPFEPRSRSHFKAVIVDRAWLYLGSANLTGAGLGARADSRRNFELGLCTEDFDTLDRVSALFEAIWSGAECSSCRLRHICPDPIAPPPQNSLVHLGHPRRLGR